MLSMVDEFKHPPARQRELLDVIRKRGILRPRELRDMGFSRVVLDSLVRRGLVERWGRGLYAAADADIHEHAGLAAAVARVPHAVICLLSAARFHGLTTIIDPAVWLAIPTGSREPSVSGMQLRIVRASPTSHGYGVERHTIAGVDVPITSPEKTVADAFKYRTRVGRDVALEVLAAYLELPSRDLDDLWRALVVCRVSNVAKPYLEGMLQ